MRFEDTGLPKNETVEKAFDISYRSFDIRRREQFKQFEQQFEKQARLSSKRFLDDPNVSDQEKNAIRQELERQIKAQKQQIQAQANREISEGFKNFILKPAQTMNTIMGDAADANKLAAVMLCDMGTNPEDFAILKAEFDKEIVDIVTDIQDLEVNYSQNLAEGIVKLNNDAKSVYLSLVISDLNAISEQAAKLQPGQQMQLQGGDEQMSMFVRNAAAAKGAEPKMDAAFVKAFNTLSKHVDAGLELRDNKTKGKYEMRRTKKNAPSNAFNNKASNMPSPMEQPQFFIMYNPDGPVAGKKPEVQFTFVPARPPGM